MPPAPTPHSRVFNLLAEALPLIARDHPAFTALEEAHRVAGGLDQYVEDHSSPLIVPATHGVPEEEVRAVWAELLTATDAEDWRQRFTEGTTQFALNAGMVSQLSYLPRPLLTPGTQCSGGYEASVLQTLAIMSRSTRVLEIGLFTGTTSVGVFPLPVLPLLMQTFAARPGPPAECRGGSCSRH